MKNEEESDSIDMKFLSINENELHKEWLRQSSLYAKYAIRLAEADREVDEAKAKLTVEAAECEKAIREAPSNFGVKKVTEPAIKAAIILHPTHQQAVRRVTKAKYNAAIIDAAVKALEHKKRALENLVSLWLGDYFSNPTAPVGTRGYVDEATKRSVREGGKKVRKSK